MRHAADANEFFEIFRDKLGAIVRDDTWLRIGKLLARPLEDDLHFALLHRFPDFPMHDIAARPVQHTAEVIKRSGNIDVGYVDMPMFVGFQRLLKSRAFQ